MPTGQSEVENSSMRFSSLMSLDCIKSEKWNDLSQRPWLCQASAMLSSIQWRRPGDRILEYYCSGQDQWCFAQQQQNKLLFFFPALWFALNTISLCWSSRSQQFGLHFPSIRNFAFFIIRKVEITRYEPLKSLATSIFVAKQCCFFSPVFFFF